ncbi:cation-transporting P-type ATPase [Pelatocladus sp. BLCC-F211]|uniref:cation-transporting P-type ATPase n=1 Tax=Pelatocladus sp. BLCC-F211 TaxID=3342752 RepID=UPI0035BA9778
MNNDKTQAWHAISLERVLETVSSSWNGLTETEAKARLQRFGANRLPQQPAPGAWQILLRQFCSPLIYILGLAALVSAIIGDVKDAGFIVAVVLINALIGGFQEWRAEKSSRALQQLRYRRCVRRFYHVFREKFRS